MKQLALLMALMVSCTACVLAQNQNFPGGGAGGTFGPNYSVGGGAAQAQTVAPTGAVTNVTLVNGYTICWLPIAANTGAAPTLAGGGTSTFTAKPITKIGAGGLTALIANDIVTTAIACAIYDGTEFQLQNPQAGIVVSGSLSIGSGASAAGATATGGFAAVEAASTGWTPTAGQDYMRADSTSHAFLCSWNGAAEALCGGAAFPLTVTGGISGGIPYFSSTTVESASPILNTGFLMKGGGAGNPPTNSLCDEGATTANTITCTDTAGIVAPKFVSSGTTAGFVDYPQGTTNAAVAPCNAATSICEQAPTAVTSYLLNKLAGPSSGIKLESNAASVLTESSSGDSNHSVHVTAQTATKTIYTICPATAGGCNVAGQYRVTWYFNQGGTACGTPTPGQVTFALSWTDNAGAHSAIALPMNDNSSIAVFTSAFKFAASNTTGFASGEFNLWSTGAQPIQVTNTYTACGVGTGTWELTAAVEQVQ